MKYAYLRVSTREQNIDRQVSAVKAFAPDIESKNIFSDKQSGKNFDREGYQRLKQVVCRGDEVIIKELDRLGRNKDGIKAELKWFKDVGVIMRVLDVPTTLIDFKGQDWIADMVNNILIEVMGAIAEQERKKIGARQREGLDAMPVVDGRRISTKTGKPIGRPEKDIICKLNDGETITDACKRLGISRTQWYREIKKQNNPLSSKSTGCPVQSTLTGSVDTGIVSCSCL